MADTQDRFTSAMVRSFEHLYDSTFWDRLHEILNPFGFGRGSRLTSVLDLGSGPCLHLQRFCAEREVQQWIAWDTSEEMLRYGMKRCEGAPFLGERKDAEVDVINHTPLDAILINRLLHSVREPREVLRRCSAPLVDGGIIVISDWIRHSFEKYSSSLTCPPWIESRYEYFKEAYLRFARYSKADLIDICTVEGLEVKGVFEFGDLLVAVVLAKTGVRI